MTGEWRRLHIEELDDLVSAPNNVRVITVHVLMNGNERGVKGVELLAVFGTSMSKGFLDNGIPETIKGRNILGQRLRPGVFKEKQIL